MVKRIDIAKWLLGLFAVATIGFAPWPAFSHGSLTMEEDRCKLRIGRYQIHFAGYQPHDGKSATRFSEFCEDIPAGGPVYVVLDLIDPELRTIPISVQVLESRGRGKDNLAPVVFQMPRKSYPTGSLYYRYTFDEPGNFVGLVTAGAGADRIVARFPFSVGQKTGWWAMDGATGVFYVISLFIVATALFLIAIRSHERAKQKMNLQE